MFKEAGEKRESSYKTREKKHSRSWDLLTMANVEKLSSLNTEINYDC